MSAAPSLDRTWSASDSFPHLGLEVVDVFDGRPAPDEAIGSACISFLNPGGAAQAYFRLLRPHGFTGRPIEVEIELLADREDEIHLEYDSLDASVRVAPRTPGVFKKTRSRHLPQTGDWHRIHFSIDDGKFYRLAHGADFRVVSSRPVGKPLRIRRVRLSTRGAELVTASRPPAALSGLAFGEAGSSSVSLIIPTWNGLDLLCDCLWSIRRSTAGAYEVIVVDEGSSDGTVEALRSVPGLRLLELGRHFGHARACNAGAAAARSRFLLFLSNRIVPLSGWLAPMLAALERDPRTSVVGSLLLYPYDGLVQHAGVEIGPEGDPHLRLKLQPANAPTLEDERYVEAVGGACLLVRSKLFKKLGGFDVGFENAYDDIDFCLRVREARRRVLYAGSSMLLHHEPASEGGPDAAPVQADLERLRRRHRFRASPSARGGWRRSPRRGRGRATGSDGRTSQWAAPSAAVRNEKPAPRKARLVVVGHLAGNHVFGAERSLLDVIAAADRTLYDVSCVLPGSNDEYLGAVRQRSTDVVVFPYTWWSKTRPVDWEAVDRFEEFFRRVQATLVHVNTVMVLDPLVAAKRLGIPAVVHARELLDQDEALMARFGEDPSSIVDRIHRACDFVIANSEATRRLYHREGRSFRLYNSVDLEQFDLPNDPKPGKFRIGIVSDNQRRKGIEHFVRLAALAAHRRSDFEFLVIGPRNEETEWLEHQEGAPPNLFFLGYVADSVEAIRWLNVVVSFSWVGESFGRTIAEAMAARRPVVAYDWGATSELVRDGTDGFLVPHLEFAKALAPLETLADHPERLREMGGNARRRAEELFSPTAFASRLNEIYREILGAWEAHPRDAR